MADQNDATVFRSLVGRRTKDGRRHHEEDRAAARFANNTSRLNAAHSHNGGLKFAALCPTIMLMPEATQFDSITVISAPFKYKELVTAIDKQATDYIFHIGSRTFVNDRTLTLIKISGKKPVEIKLTRIECSILKCLARAAQDKKFVAEQTLLKTVFGYHPSVCTNTARTHICRLRQKIGKGIIENSGEGYYLSADNYIPST